MTVIDERYCDNCDDFTMQSCIDSTHERDSSADWRKCLVCEFEYDGISGKYYKPLP